MLVYMLDEGSVASRAASLRGGKGSSLAELVSLGMPVPLGATMTTVATQLFSDSHLLPASVTGALRQAIAKIEKGSGLVFGSADHPLLLSVRSGAPLSMPGMLDTVLNIGMNEETVLGLAGLSGERFAWDCYRRFLAMFGSIVMDVPGLLFEKVLGNYAPADIDACSLRKICAEYLQLIAANCNANFKNGVPADPYEQLQFAISAVIGSWRSERAQAYRNSENISHDGGTAVTIQAMVFGNFDAKSGTGVVFSADPGTGQESDAGNAGSAGDEVEKALTGEMLYGEYLPQAQGEDVVSGACTPLPLRALAQAQPKVYAQLRDYVAALATHYDDIVDVEFTVQSGVLYLLQCRPAKRTALASAVFAVRQVQSGRWERSRALAAVNGVEVERLSRPAFAPQALTAARAAPGGLLLRGLPASPGCVTGELTFNLERARALYFSGRSVILARSDTAPEDLPVMLMAQGLVTACGGTTSHAAVVARSKGIPAVVGCDFRIDEAVGASWLLWNGERFLSEGEIVSLDGSTGIVVSGALPLVPVANGVEVAVFLGWLNEQAALAVPRAVDLSWARERHCLNVWLNDFYLTESICDALALAPVAASDADFVTRAKSLRDRICADLAALMLCYLLYTITAELGFFRLRESEAALNCAAWRTLAADFGVHTWRAGSTLGQAAVVVARVADLEISEQLRFFQNSALVFDCLEGWEDSFGGGLWAKIARAACTYLSGEAPPAAFVDHVFDLRHHGGHMFDNHIMTSFHTRERVLVQQLQAKKDATAVGALFQSLTALWSCRGCVTALFQEGAVLGIWH